MRHNSQEYRINPALVGLITYMRKAKMEVKESNSKFVKLRCPKCKNEQITFGKAAIKVQCLVCGKNLADPTGGKTKCRARILEVLD